MWITDDLFQNAKLHTASEAKMTPAPLVLAAYYMWYGTPRTDGRFLHWNHHVLPHWTAAVRERYPEAVFIPPHDIHAPFYPARGLYSSRDAEMTAAHFADMREHGIDAAIASWWGRPDITKGDSQGVSTDEMFQMLLDVGEKTGVKVAFHLEPYEGRSASSVREDIHYLVHRYGSHPALLRIPRPGTNSPLLPVYFVYDSYHIPSEQWSELFHGTATSTLRGTAADGTFIGLWLDHHHGEELARAGFDGAYTYFASDGFSYGSSLRNWPAMATFCRERGLYFFPSVGPGYSDSKIRPWNSHNTRPRKDGEYYAHMWNAALETRTPFVSITSYNEWGEGTQIEGAAANVVIDVEALAPLGLALNASLRAALSLPDAYDDYGGPGTEQKYMLLTAEWARKLRDQHGGDETDSGDAAVAQRDEL